VEQQLGYARGKGELDFGARHADALFVSFEGANTAGVQDEIARRLEPVALSAKLEVLSRELPVELARQLGDVAIAGEVYELRFALSKRPDQPKSPAAWRDARVGVEVIHSRERLLLAAAQFDGIEALTRALPALLPTRAAVTEARAGELSLRIVGTVTEGSFQVPGHGGTLGRADWLAVPCAAEEGQCFTAAATVAQAESARP
jgi:hypothetical protein